MGTNYSIKKISWKEYDELAGIILDKICDYKIDCVIPVLRGGAVIGMTIANKIGAPMCYIRIKSSISNEINSSFSQPKMMGGIGLDDITNKNVLVCEDIIDTEMTIKEVVRQLSVFNPKKILIASLFNFSNNDEYICGYKADYHFWVVFPWEVMS